MVVVLANDDADFLAIIAYSLRRHGYEVIESRADTAAFVSWYVTRPDAMVLDVMDLNQAMAALDAIRNLDAKTPVVLSTVSSDGKHIAELRRRGATAVLAKPYLVRQLIDVLESLEHGSRGEESIER